MSGVKISQFFKKVFDSIKTAVSAVCQKEGKGVATAVFVLTILVLYILVAILIQLARFKKKNIAERQAQYSASHNGEDSSFMRACAQIIKSIKVCFTNRGANGERQHGSTFEMHVLDEQNNSQERDTGSNTQITAQTTPAEAGPGANDTHGYLRPPHSVQNSVLS
ncbi:hypothetical protein KGF57_001955, partial [Candida theae]